MPVNFKVLGSIAAEIEARRLDTLGHYSALFDIDKEIHAEYFDRFTALVEALKTADLPITLREQAAVLTEAGRRQDACRIRETLPAFCHDISAHAAAHSQKQKPLENKIARGILQQLKNALREGNTSKAGKILTEMGSAKLGPEERAWYFTLYDLLLEDNTQKALERIEKWLKH